jgi:hypothetical protein
MTIKHHRFNLDTIAQDAVREHTSLLDTRYASDREVIISIGRNLGRGYLDCCIDAGKPISAHDCDGYVGDNVLETGILAAMSASEYDVLCDYAREEAGVSVDA